MNIYAALGSGFVSEHQTHMEVLAQKYCKYRLFSYAYHATTENLPSDFIESSHASGDNLLFLDSGAFTVWNQKQKKKDADDCFDTEYWRYKKAPTSIDIDRYAQLINSTDGWWDVIANLDIIGGSEKANWENLRDLESNGCKVCPVFHAGEDPWWLSKMLDSYEYILIGGLVKNKNLQADLDQIFKSHLTDSSGQVRCKLHGFGLTGFDLMLRYPWYSVDSTSWVSTARYGSCVFYRSGKLQQVLFSKDNEDRFKSNSVHYDRMPEAEQETILKLLEPTGITLDEVCEDYNGRRVVNLHTFQQVEQHVHSTHFHPDD